MDYKEKDKPKRPYINGMAIASALGAISTRFERVFATSSLEEPSPEEISGKDWKERLEKKLKQCSDWYP